MSRGSNAHPRETRESATVRASRKRRDLRLYSFHPQIGVRRRGAFPGVAYSSQLTEHDTMERDTRSETDRQEPGHVRRRR
jgi:hypothetical protein